MKLTESRLRQIIREVLEDVVLTSKAAEINAMRSMGSIERGPLAVKQQAEYEDPTYDGLAAGAKVIEVETDLDLDEAISRQGLSPDEAAELEAFESGYIDISELSPTVRARAGGEQQKVAGMRTKSDQRSDGVGSRVDARAAKMKNDFRPKLQKRPPGSTSEKCDGFNKPAFKGSVAGQVACPYSKSVALGKFRPIIDPLTGKKDFIPVKTKIDWHAWEWDGQRWVPNPFDEDAYVAKVKGKK